MAEIIFDPDNTLAGGLYALTPREAIKLGIGLCAAVEESVGVNGCHGAIWPGNISFVEGQAAIGPATEINIKDISADALEYIAPEQFWNGESLPASDVYSVGLLLYTALNGGVMPFFEGEGERSPEERATALQSRMKGREFGYPRTACRELGDVVLKAMAFKAGDRYANLGELKAALEALPEGAAVPAVAPVIRLTPSEVKNTHSYKVDKDFEPMEPDKPEKLRKVKKPKAEEAVDENMDAAEFRKTRKKSPVVPILVALVAVVAVIVVLFHSCGADQPVDPTPTATPVLEASPAPVETPEPTPPVETPQQTPAQTEEPEPTATPQPTYQIIVEDVTWEEAKAKCEALGGHLATVKSQDELDYIIAMAENAGAQFVWLGAYRGQDNIWYYVTGETMSFASWDTGEPSAMDADGTREDYLLLWYRKQLGTWSYNDMRNDPISVIPATYSGKTAYVCQFD